MGLYVQTGVQRDNPDGFTRQNIKLTMGVAASFSITVRHSASIHI